MVLVPTDEARVLALLKQGGRRQMAAAFDLVFRGLESEVLAVCVNLTRHAQDAEDALQETMVAVYQGLSGFRGESKVKTWVLRIAIRRALRVRDARLRAPSPANEALLLARGGSVDPSRGLETADAMRHAMQSLSAEHRTVLVLFGVKGLGHEEIAAILGVPTGTVWSRLHGARKKLAAALEGGD